MHQGDQGDDIQFDELSLHLKQIKTNNIKKHENDDDEDNKHVKSTNKNQSSKYFNQTDTEEQKIAFKSGKQSGVTTSTTTQSDKEKQQINHFGLHNQLKKQWSHLMFSPDFQEKQFLKHLNLCSKGLIYSKKCLKGPSEAYLQQKAVTLKSSKNPKKYTLLLDLDETLIHCCNIKESPQCVLKVCCENGEETIISFNVRPYCQQFLQTLSEYYDIYVFTASTPLYARIIVNYLDPRNLFINDILNRDNCMMTRNGFYIKDLRIIQQKDIGKMILVDNLTHSFGLQIDNGVPILEWKQDQNDKELLYLINYLIEASKCENVREYNNEKLKLSLLAEEELNLANLI